MTIKKIKAKPDEIEKFLADYSVSDILTPWMRRRLRKLVREAYQRGRADGVLARRGFNRVGEKRDAKGRKFYVYRRIANNKIKGGSYV